MERAELASALQAWRVRERGPIKTARFLLTEPDPAKFPGALADALADTGEIFLGNPQWSESERRGVDEFLHFSPPGPRLRQGWLMIPTGGTSGEIRFARHDSQTIGAAVQGFLRHFDLPRVNAVGLLPLFHVSGLMAWLRCALTGGGYITGDWKKITAGQMPGLPKKDDGWVLSLVPTQLERLLREPSAVEWLRRFRVIFVGGGPAWPELLDRAADAKLPLSLGYGMTETAAMVTALKPEEFLAGQRSSGTALPHARVSVNAEGVISLAGESLFRGYYPQWREERTFTTEDLGAIDEAGRLTVLGRRDGVIITGGEKVHPAEVEAVLRGTGEFADVAVLGVPHAEWGQQVVAAYAAGATSPNLRKVGQVIASRLSPPKRPKRYVSVPDWPRNAQGKLMRLELVRLVQESMQAETRKPSS
jgi:O-succinylbenzoic acid--CoA ligase